MPKLPSRRTFLHVMAASGISSIAGCSSGRFEPPPLPSQPTRDARQFQYDTQNRSVTGTEPPTDGTQRWKIRRDELGSNGKAIDGLVALDDHLLAATQAAIHSLAPTDGSERWRTDPGYDGSLPAATPALSGDTAYVVWQQHEAGGLSALDLADGSIRWQSDPIGIINTDLTLGGDTIYALVFQESEDEGFERALVAIDTADGGVNWRYPTPMALSATPAVADGTVYVAGGTKGEGTVYAIDAETGEKRWDISIPEWMLTSPTVADGTVYVPADSAGTLYAFDTVDGTEKWSVSLSSNSVAATSESVYVPANDKITILDTDGTKRWERSLTDSYLPVVAGKSLVLGGEDGAVCLDLTDNTFHWKQTVEAGIYGHEKAQGISCVPVVTNDRVFLGTPAGDIYAVGE
jgi:outer membrane protein assembly factor BamB